MNISITMTSDERTKALQVLYDGIQEMIAACDVDEDGALDTPSSRDVERTATDLLDALSGILGIESATASRW